VGPTSENSTRLQEASAFSRSLPRPHAEPVGEHPSIRILVLAVFPKDSFTGKKHNLSPAAVAGVIMGAVVAGLLLHLLRSSSSPEESARPRAHSGGAGTAPRDGSDRRT
jgi:hypothetical protein